MEIVTVRENGSFEFTEKKSVFMSRAFFVRDEASAMAALDEVRRQHPEAKHHVWAYSLSNGGKRFTDDGEPSGTGGMPVLKVLELSGLQDVMIVVTRYFGGILLGAGGLTRAYTRAAAGVVEISGRAHIVGVVPFFITCGYDFQRSVQKAVTEGGGTVSDTVFTDKVRMTCAASTAEFDRLLPRLRETFYTNITVETGEPTWERR